MAVDLGKFNKYPYIQKVGITLSLVEYLLSELETESQYSSASYGIQLPIPGTSNHEYIPLKEAAELVIGWAQDNTNLKESEGDALLKLITSPGGTHQVSIIISNAIKARVSDPHKLLSSRLIQNVAQWQEIQKQAASAPADKYNPAASIVKWNTTLTKVYGIANNPALRKQLGDALPVYLKTISGGDITEQAMIDIIVANLPALVSVSALREGVPDIRDNLAAQKLESIIARSNPRLAGIAVLMGDPLVAGKINNYIQRIANEYQSSGGNLTEMDRQSLAAAKALSDILPARGRLSSLISKSLPNLNSAQRDRLAEEIIRETVRSTNKPLTADEIVKQASAKIGFNTAEADNILNQLRASGQDVAIEYRQSEMVMMVGSHRLTEAEKSLMKRGINPFNTHRGLSEVKSEAISDFGFDKNQLSDNAKSISAIEQAIFNEKQAANPDYFRLRRLDELLDYYHTDSLLSSGDRRLISRSRFERYFHDLRSRSNATETNFFDKWTEIEEKLPWNRAVHKTMDLYDRLAEKLVIKIPFKDRKTGDRKLFKIPLIGFVAWADEAWLGYKLNIATKWLISLRGTKSIFGRFAQFGLRNYIKGGGELDGAIYSATREAWGRSLNWIVQKTTKYASFGALRSATIASIGNFAGKILIKIGGEAALKLGSKAIAAIVAASTVIGSALSIALAAFMIWDLVKLGYNLLKEFIRNADFRGKALMIGAALGAFFSIANLTGLLAAAGLWLGSIIAGALIILFEALTAIAISIVTVALIRTTMHKTVRIDSGIVQQMFGGSTTVDCFVFQAGGQQFPKNDKETGSAATEGWSEGDLNTMKSAIQQMKSSWGGLIESVCKGGDINLWRDSHSGVSWGGWAMSGNDIRIYNNGVASALYTLSHELGHIFATRVGGVSDFIAQRFVFWNPAANRCENNIYPANPSSEGMCYGENFAELISWVVSGHKSPPSSWSSWVITNILGGKK